MSFVVGSKVKWTSQAQGSTKTKTGVVVRVIPAGSRPAKEEVEGAGFARKHESYLIEADKPRNRRYYWPLVSKLIEVIG